MGTARGNPAAIGGIAVLVILLGIAACSPGVAPPQTDSSIQVLATETFLADIAQNVAGDRLRVDALVPVGVDPHSFEPTPGDLIRISRTSVLIANGAGFEPFLDRLLRNAGGKRTVIEAAAGLQSRQPSESEEPGKSEVGGGQPHENDPHFWLDPNNVIHYVENIRKGLSEADPSGAPTYAANANAYIARLRELDAWILRQVSQVPRERRKLVTNHESLGYYADRYGFEIVGTIVPSVSTGASPSAQQLAHLVDQIRATSAKAIFMETGSNPQLARQLAQETGIKVVTELYTHSTGMPGGPASSYIEMIRFNTQTIVDALK